jgi:chaperonin cofactor prefoldin
MAYTSYAGLEAKYANLQNQYNTLEANYTTLKTNYNNLQSQYQTLQTQYNSLQSQYSSLQTNYTTLQNQYNTLESNYSELNNTYWELFTFLGQDNWYNKWSSYLHMTADLPREWITAPANSTTASVGFGVWLGTGQYAGIWVVVPSNYSATISITANATESPVPVDVYVFNLSNYVLWLEGYSPTYYLHAQGTYINDTVTVPGPGIYIVVLYNPSNTTTAEINSGSVFVTFIQTSG